MIWPSFETFSQAYRRFNAVPFGMPIRGVGQDPFPVFAQLARRFSPTFFLDSYGASASSPARSAFAARLARYSYFPLAPPAQTFTAYGARDFAQVWKGLGANLKHRAAPALRGPHPPFQGGIFMTLSYDCGRVFEPGWTSRGPQDELKFPWIFGGFYDDIAAFDHHTKRAWIFSVLKKGKGRALRNLRSEYERHARKMQALADPLTRALRNSRTAPGAQIERAQNLRWKRRTSPQQFMRRCRQVQNYIAAGDIYQANLSQRMAACVGISGLELAGRLRRINPSPYAGYARAGAWELVSSSPELLLRKRGARVETRPIAGTRPRGENRRGDRRMEGELLLSPKERAEHVMLVDLERNDLGRVCEPGSVRVEESMAVERYSHVMHIVSHVAGRLRAGVNALTALESVFPGGTITGCPKIRCMEILDQLEPVARGPFYGAMGWVSYSGDAEFNLLIRTAILKKNSGRKKSAATWQATVQTGSGIVADSRPARELQETLQKARALVEAAVGRSA